jgi:hypothetical protein
MTSIRNRALFVQQKHFEKLPTDEEGGVANFIHRTDELSEKWIEETTERIGDWKNLSRSIYLRWAITINAMCIAERHYEELPGEKALQTVTMRSVHGKAIHAPLAIWSGKQASEHYRQSTELVAAYAVADLVGAIEDIVFEAFEVFIRHNPEKFTRGKDNKAFRKLFRDRESNPTVWASAFEERFKSWRRKKIYDGLYTVMADYWKDAALLRPSAYKDTDISNWCASVQMFSELRNLIVHGASNVSKELAAYCQIQTSMTFDFKEGELLHVELHHLQSIECFLDQYLSALNISLIEKANGMIAG